MTKPLDGIALLTYFRRLKLSKEAQELLTNIRIDGAHKRLSIGVSFGFADFSGAVELEKAVKDADAEMYRYKQENKSREIIEEVSFVPNGEETIPQLIAN